MVAVDGFEGPLDLLLALARNQQVDLTRISILALANQYLAFIEQARELKIEIAADYLVMAAWLAYLKSRLLLPEPPEGEEPSAADLAADLAARLQHLEAIRQAGARLMTRHRLGHDFFACGMPKISADLPPSGYTATLYDLLSAYAMQRQRQAILANMKFPVRTVWSLVEARDALARLLGKAADWTRLDEYLIAYVVEPSMRATVFASSFSATLEMVREGKVEIQQDKPFSPLWLRRRIEGRPEKKGAKRQCAWGARAESSKAAGKWASRTAPDLGPLLAKHVGEPKKLSRAAVETLAIVAYHQPVTRAEIEEIRGVALARGALDRLLEAGWVRPRGRRDTPGRPVTYGTSETVLSHFGLDAVGDLPGLEELKGSGLLDGRLPPGFSVPMPSDDPGLRDDEDPLEPGDLDLGLAPPPERISEE